MTTVDENVVRVAEGREARAVNAGVNAFDLGVHAKECPYPADLAKYWHMGWTARRTATQRWERQADEVDATLALAQDYIDRDTPAGEIKRSLLIGLHFYAYGSIEPDAAYKWFKDTMEMARDQYRLSQADNAA